MYEREAKDAFHECSQSVAPGIRAVPMRHDLGIVSPRLIDLARAARSLLPKDPRLSGLRDQLPIFESAEPPLRVWLGHKDRQPGSVLEGYINGISRGPVGEGHSNVVANPGRPNLAGVGLASHSVKDEVDDCLRRWPVRSDQLATLEHDLSFRGKHGSERIELAVPIEGLLGETE